MPNAELQAASYRLPGEISETEDGRRKWLREGSTLNGDGSFQDFAVPTLIGLPGTGYARYGKRLLDIVGSVLAMVLFLPVFVLIALTVRWRLGPGEIIFRQSRVGLDGKSFTIYKFRSMLPDRRSAVAGPYVGTERRKNHKSDDDPRHTTFGRILRTSSLDELPQLLNVLKGEMSLVGPRPELVVVAKQQGFLNHPRHLARPGLTGLFQISELRNKNKIASGLHLDVAYVSDVRFRTDLVILFKTIFVLLGSR